MFLNSETERLTMERQKRDIYLIDEPDIGDNVDKIEDTFKRELRYCFATRLNKILKEKKITQKEFCADTGIATGTLSAYRTGNKEPTITNLKKIVDYLNVSADYLIGKAEVKSVDEIDKVVNKRFGFSDEAIKALSHAVSNSKAHKEKNLAVEALNILFTPCDKDAKEADIPDLRFIWHLRDYLFTTTDDYRNAINKRMFNTAYGTEKVTTEDLEEISFNRIEKRLKFFVELRKSGYWQKKKEPGNGRDLDKSV